VPELPDVEGFRTELADSLPGRKIRDVKVRDAGVLRNRTARNLKRELTGHRFAVPRRHGKWLILPTDGPTVLVHSGMTGRPYYAPAETPEEGTERLTIALDSGELRYTDLRKLRGVWLADDDSEIDRIMGPLGPDAFDISLRKFNSLLNGRRGGLKATLMDQSVIAGLGNLLTDEICWQACVHPVRRISSLDVEEVKRLHTTMRRVLRTSVRHRRVPRPRRWLTGVRDDPDPTCPRCGARLVRGSAGGRTTLWCPRCQHK
jgi:formamidopyrimidine-DNA glycosylase